MLAVVLALAALATWGTIATFVVVARDGYGRVPTRDAWETPPRERHPWDRWAGIP